MRHSFLTGLDVHEPNNILVENATGAPLATLKVVSLDGFGVLRPKIKLVTNPISEKAFGIVASTIPNTSPNNLGIICSLGFMYNINTSSFNVGDSLYSDSSGNLTTTALGNKIAYVTKKDAVSGILFVSGLTAFIDPEANAWNVLGNAGTNETVNFIGTTDAQGLRFKVNNNLTSLFDTAGRFGLGPDLVAPKSHFHQKSHLNYPESGLRQETFAFKTSVNTPQTAYVINIPDPSVVRIEFIANARQSDGTARASFKRTGLFYREAGNVQIEDKWQSDSTIRSNPAFLVSYVMGTNTLTLKVKAANSADTLWSGHVKIEILTTET